MDLENSRRLLRTHQFGRLAVRSETGVDLYPVNYLVHGDELFFRTAPGSKVDDIAQHPEVAFEIDGGRGRHVWSVIVHGTAELLDDGSPLGRSQIAASDIAAFRPWLRGEKAEFVRIAPHTVTGRRFTTVPRQWGAASIMIAGAIVALAVGVVALLATILR